MKPEYETNINGLSRPRRPAWLIAGLLALLLLPGPAWAIKQTPPLTMTAAFDNAQPAAGTGKPSALA